MTALDAAVRSGRALYVGISSYGPQLTREATAILHDLKTPFVIHRPSYSMLNRRVDNGLLEVLEQEGIGCIAFSPLAQGLLTDKYLHGIPKGSRASKPHGFLRPEHVTPDKIARVKRLDKLARVRGQTLAQMALAWVLRHPGMTSALVGASRVAQIEDAVGALNNLTFGIDELRKIEAILKS